MADDRRSVLILTVAAGAAHRKVLRAAGYRVLPASSLEEARAVLSATRVDLLVLGAGLPPETVRDLRADLAVAPPALYLGAEYAEQAGGEGVDTFLPDAPHPRLLLANVAALLRTRRVTAELARAREECEEAEQTLRALLEYIPQGILISGAPEIKLRGVSRFALALSGMTPEQLQDLLTGERPGPWQALFADGATDMPAEEMPLNRATHRGEVITDLEMALRRPDGQVVYLLVDAGPIRDDAGAVVGGIVAWREITERRRFGEERERLLSEATRWRTLLDAVLYQMPTGVLVLDPEGNLTLSNRAAQRLSPHPLQGLVQEAYRQGYRLRHPDGSPYTWEELPGVQALRTGEMVTDEEMRITRPESTEAVAAVSASPLRDAQGRITGAVVLFSDITEAKRAREERERQARLLETLVENTQHWLAYLDRNLRFMLTNSAFASTSPLPRDELVGRHFLEVFPDQVDVYRLYERARDTGEVISGRELPTHLPGPPELGVHCINFNIAPVKDARGAVEGIVLSAEDVTEQVQTREQLLTAERARVDLVENLNREISHRVKNNLMMLAGLLHLQSQEHADPQLTSILHETASRLLAFASIHEQLQTSPEGIVNLLAALSRLIEATRSAFAARGIEFIMEGEPVELPAQPATNLAVVANELITNAAKYCDPGPVGLCRVKIVLHRDGEDLHLSVWNSGHPVPRNFDAEHVTTLGLRLVWNLVVEQYGGTFVLRPRQGGSLAEACLPLPRLTTA